MFFLFCVSDVFATLLKGHFKSLIAQTEHTKSVGVKDLKQ